MQTVFIDTEFTGFEIATQEIISLGLVSEDGKHEFYVENTSHHEVFRSKFVHDIVVPLLNPEAFGHPYKDCCRFLNVFLMGLPGEVNIIYDYHGDVDLVLPMLSSEVKNKVSFELFQPALIRILQWRGVHTDTAIDNAIRYMMLEGESYYSIDPRQHHALVDAKANRHAFLNAIKEGMA
jgi:hypothetical protein